MIHLDTHAVMWIAQRQSGRFSAQALRLLESDRLAISPIVELEFSYLAERGRLRVTSGELLRAFEEFLPLSRSQASFSQVIHAAKALSWTRDPFDRLIVATAIADGAKLLTADRMIRANFPDAVW